MSFATCASGASVSRSKPSLIDAKPTRHGDVTFVGHARAVRP
jgi:hypothetical protein